MKFLIYILVFTSLLSFGQNEKVYEITSDSISIALFKNDTNFSLRIMNLHSTTMLFDTVFYNAPYEKDTLGIIKSVFYSFAPRADFHTNLSLLPLKRNESIDLFLTNDIDLLNIEEFFVEILYICTSDFAKDNDVEILKNFSSFLFVDCSRRFWAGISLKRKPRWCF